jgi:anti-repressor protein
MNALSTITKITESTMTSREISDLVESRHDDVKRSIERLAERGVISLPPLAEVSNTGPGPKTTSVYQICKRDSYIIVAQLSPEFTAKLVDRWQELESKQSVSLPSYPEALRQLANTIEINTKLQMQAQEDAPKVEFAMAVRQMEGSCKIGDFCKTLKIGRNTFFRMLRNDEILMETNLPYQRYIDAKLFVVIEQIPYTDSKGVTQPTFTTMVTGKGQVWLERKYRKQEPERIAA